MSYVIPLAFLTGGGLLPTLIGGVGDYLSLSAGLVMTGVLVSCASLCSWKLSEDRT